MKPIEFKEQNVVFAKDQPEYQPLPAFVNEQHQAVPVVTCWQLSEEEKAKILETGVIWLSMWTFGRPLQPVLLTVDKTDLIREMPEEQPKRQFIQHYVYEMDVSLVQKCAVCGEIIMDQRCAVWPAGHSAPSGYAEGPVYVSVLKNPTILQTTMGENDEFIKCTPKDDVLTEEGFVFIDEGSRPFWCRMYYGNPWIMYWHPDNKWVTKRQITQTEIWDFKKYAIPAEAAKIYHDLHEKN